MTATRPGWTPVSNPRIRVHVEQLTEQLGLAARDHFEERAGILEYESGMDRAAAEELALQQIRLAFCR
ncbi:hypothetical protein [Noviherbaspirillum autotrophicum]|uniref:Uncharacterized protein n=1 Tax=Noviherbaspirillum autotrophicum TaxID=709839 RepID=A0A0C2BPS1_9BURK|nr:hypothetical protein [Noviherbaspirillum autotrophicum]KIF80051.1 hypothetical protein TSA66_03245 [Noviherbaspirillum autotrophicum]